MKLSLLVKLLIAFTITTLLSAALGVYAIFTMRSVTRPLNQIKDNAMASILAIQTLENDLAAHHTAVFNYALMLDPGEKMSQEKVVAAMETALHKANDDYRKTISDPEERQLADKFQYAMNKYLEAIPAVMSSAKSNDLAGSQTDLFTTGTLYDLAKSYADKLVAVKVQQAEALRKTATDTYNRGDIALPTISALIVLLGLVLGQYMARQVTLPVRSLAASVRQVAEGDLSQPDVIVKTGDEIADLARDFNRMTQNLRNLAGRLRESAGLVAEVSRSVAEGAQETARAVEQVSVTLQQVSRGIQEQTGSISAIASTTEQLQTAGDSIARSAEEQARSIEQVQTINSELTRKVADLAREADTVTALARETLDVSNDGHQAVEQTITGMGRVEEAVAGAVTAMSELTKHSEKIGMIVTAITDIAEQTNLLALNAAIESARAGEAGRGFAVVAEEVRKLAARSATNAQEIADLVDLIQSSSHSALTAVDAGKLAVADAVARSGRAGKALEQIQAAVRRTDEAAHNMRSALEALNAGAQQSCVAVSEAEGVTRRNTATAREMAGYVTSAANEVRAVAAVSEETAASVEEISASSEEVGATAQEMAGAAGKLLELTEELNRLVDNFRLA